MLLYRSLSLGFLGACLLLLATRPPVVVHQIERACPPSAPAQTCPPVSPGPTILDISANMTTTDIVRLLRLSPDERVAAVDDMPVASTLEAGVKLAQVYASAGRYVDIDVHGPDRERRILVLVH